MMNGTRYLKLEYTDITVEMYSRNKSSKCRKNMVSLTELSTMSAVCIICAVFSEPNMEEELLKSFKNLKEGSDQISLKRFLQPIHFLNFLWHTR
jgi:hypothetical protein